MWKTVVPGTGMLDLPDSRSTSSATFVPGVLQGMGMVSERFCSRQRVSITQMKNWSSVDEEIRNTRKIAATLI